MGIKTAKQNKNVWTNEENNYGIREICTHYSLLDRNVYYSESVKNQ